MTGTVYVKTAIAISCVRNRKLRLKGLHRVSTQTIQLGAAAAAAAAADDDDDDDDGDAFTRALDDLYAMSGKMFWQKLVRHFQTWNQPI